MDFIEPASFDFWQAVLYATSAMMAMTMTVLIVVFWKADSKAFRRGGKATLLSIAFVFVIGAVGSVFYLDSAKYDMKSERQDVFASQVEETYGLVLSKDEVEDLEYPNRYPDSGFEVYGSFSDAGKRTYLIWEGGKMLLASSADGEKFAPLPGG